MYYSHSASPQPSGTDSGSASPAQHSSSSSGPSSRSSSAKPKTVPTNIFSNDGSFLERFKLTKKEENEKREKDALERKKAFDNRFKNRGKRPPPPTNGSDTSSSGSGGDSPVQSSQSADRDGDGDGDDSGYGGSADGGSAHSGSRKRVKRAVPLNEYEKAMMNISAPSLKDTGTGIRPLVK